MDIAIALALSPLDTANHGPFGDTGVCSQVTSRRRWTGRFVSRLRSILSLGLAAGLLSLPLVHGDDRLPVCAACHDTGAGGAPRMGRAQDWAHDELPQVLRHP